MKFIIDSLALNKALKQIAPAVQANPIFPALENILVKVDKGSCELTATNLNLTIVQKLNCESAEAFSIMLPFKQLMNISSVITAQPITIEDKGDKINIGNNHKIGKTDDAKNFPVPKNFEPIYEMDADEDFLYYLQLSTFCTSKDHAQYIYQNVCVEFRDETVNILATDAMQLFSYKKLIKQPATQVLIDTNFVKASKSIPSGKLSGNNTFIKIENDTTQIIGTLNENKFPDCSRFFSPYEYNCVINRKELMDSLNKMMVFDSKFYNCAFIFSPDKITIKFDDNDFDHHFNDDIHAKHSVDFESIAFNGALLKNLISIIPESEELNLSFKTKNALVHIDPKNSDLKLLIIPIMQ